MSYYCIFPGCPGDHKSKWLFCEAEEKLEDERTENTECLREGPTEL